MRNERGSYSILFSVILGTGLLIAIFTIVLDGGNIVAERRVLQNVADAGALALAKECVQAPDHCRDSFSIFQSTQPEQLAALNSPDGLTKITEVCVKGRNQFGLACQLPNSLKLDCATLPATAFNYVRIRTQSLNPDGGFLKPLFGADQSYQVNGCSQAIWGNVRSMPIYVPFALSICTWPKLEVDAQVIQEFKPNDGVTSCSFSDLQGNANTKSGMFGWAAIDLLSASLQQGNRASEACPDPNTDKPATVQIGDIFEVITRDSSSQNFCDDSNLESKMIVWLGKKIFIPLVSTQELQGQATRHEVQAFAEFDFQGYSIKGTKGGAFPASSSCSRNCLYGEFTETTFYSDSDVNVQPGTPNIGLQAIKLF